MKRSLWRTGGRCTTWGDPELARLLARCLDVDPDAKLPFTHGFHAYPARMHPEIARRAIEAFRPKRVLDPFVGSGTTALEAVRAGLPFAGIDCSRVALEIAWARTRLWPPDRGRLVERRGHAIAALARKIDPPGRLPGWAEPEWYSPHTLREIVALRALIDEEEPEIRRMLTVVLSSLLVKLSRQASDSATVPDRGFRPWPPRAAFGMFGDKCSELTKNLLLLSSDLHKRAIPTAEPELILGDARTRALPEADLVLTSPPYPGTYDYFRHHARRFPLFGDADFARAHELGTRQGFDANRYRRDLATVLKRLAGVPRILLLIGDGALDRVDRLVRNLAPVTAIASQRRPRSKSEYLILIGR